MLYFIDQTSEKDHHMVFNSSIIKILMLLYPNQKLTYSGINSNQESVLSLLTTTEKDRIILAPIIYSKPLNDNRFFKIINFYRKEKLRAKSIKQIFNATTTNDLVFLSITTFSSFYFFKKTKTKYPVTTIVTLHGDVDFIYNSYNYYEKLNAYFHKKIFKTKAQNFYYLLLNKIAKQRLVADNYLMPQEVLEVNHPFSVLNHYTDNENSIITKPITFGHIGSMELDRKNSHYFYQLAASFSDLIKSNQLKFATIGLITPPMLAYKNDNVVEIVGNTQPSKPDYLTRHEYEANVLKLNYALYFYQEPHYIFRASGAVIDNIAFEIPMIALKHPFFDNLFSQAGPIGYLCNNLQEVEQIIQKIVSNDAQTAADYRLFKSNIKVLKSYFTTTHIAADLKKQMNIN